MIEGSKVFSNFQSVPVERPARPWLTIWYKPRGTIRSIVDYNPSYGVIPLAVASGAASFFEIAARMGLGDALSIFWIVLLAILAGLALGLMGLFIHSRILKAAGAIFGGQATAREVRTAVAWSSLPDVLTLAFYAVAILLFGQKWFLSTSDWMDPVLALPILCLTTPVGIFIFVSKIFLSVKCLAEVNRFSAWKGLLTFGLEFAAAIIVVLVFFIISRDLY